MVHLQKLFVMRNSVSWFLLLRFNGCLSLFVSTAILLKEESYRVSMRSYGLSTRKLPNYVLHHTPHRDEKRHGEVYHKAMIQA